MGVAEPRERALRALAAQGRECQDGELRELGAGLDHAAFVAGELVVRVASGARDAVVREADLLRLLAGRLPVAVPQPCIVDPDEGVLAHRMLPGRPLLGREPPAEAARLLGHLLRDLHAIPLDAVRDLMPTDPADPQEWLDELTGPAALLRVLTETRPGRAAEVLVPAHADLGAEHILESDGVLSGIIDWSDAAVTDPALDFARLYRDFGAAFLDETLAAYGGVDQEFRERVAFFARCAAVEDFAYGAEPGRLAYRRAAERSIAWLFPG